MTGSRRLAPLSILLIAAAVLAALIVPGATAQAQSQNERTPPSNLAARLVRGGVELTWDRPAQNDESVDGYEILRRRPNQGEQTLTTLVSDTATTDTTYFDTTATEPGVRYNYQVKAIRNGVTSRPSNTATVLVLLSAPTTRLVSNVGQPRSATASITQQYALGFRLGTHGQGYEISSVSIDLAAVPSDLAVSLWVGGPDGMTVVDGTSDVQRELFEFDNPASFKAGLNKFTAPEGAFAYPNVNYFIVLSGFGSSLSIKQTASDHEDPGVEPGAILFNSAVVRALGSTGRWDSPATRGSVLRLALEGSKRDRGILAANFTGAAGGQEIISVGDDCCFEMAVGSADRYLIRGVSVPGDDTTVKGGFFGIPFQMRNSSSDDTLFTLPYASAQGSLVDGPLRLTSPAGMSDWTAPQGATVAGNQTYVLHMNIRSIEGDTLATTRGGVVLSRIGCSDIVRYTDTPSAPGVTLSDHGDIACPTPQMAVDGEPLHAMVANLRQADDGYVTAKATGDVVVSQGFSTGPRAYGYRLQGIGVNVEGSDDTSNNPQIPDGPSSVSVAVHADSGGKPGAKLFDLVSPDGYAAGDISFFEAPTGTTLAPDTSYVMVWTYRNGEEHRLQRTLGDDEDGRGTLDGFTMANAFYHGADLNNLTKSSDDHALEIAVYGEAIDAAFLAQPRPVSDIEVPDGPLLVSNVGQSRSATASITQQYALGFRLGSHGQGYEISGVSVDLAAVPSSGLTVSLWSGGPPGTTINASRAQRKLFEFDNPGSFEVGLNRFTAPAGAFAYPNVNYFIVLSGFGSSLSITETASDDEDPGGEPDAVLFDNAVVRALGSTGRWDSPSTRSGGRVLRLALEGSRRGRGILAANFTGATGTNFEQVSVGDDCCFDIAVGSADRYLIRGVTVAADDTTPLGGFFGLEFELQNSSDETLFTLPYASAQGALAEAPLHLTAPPGLNDWTAPQGATVAGSKSYTFHMNIRSITGDTVAHTRGGITVGRVYCSELANYTDTPSVPGVTLAAHGDLACTTPSMAVDGEPLVAMVANLDQDNDSYATATSTNDVISQGFETGPSAYGYRLQGIGVDVEGSDDSDSDPQIPDGPSSVSVAVHAAKSDGKPGVKLFDLVSPGHYAAGELAFFEAPPGTRLDPDTSYVMVWTKLNGEDHRLWRTLSDDEEDDPRRLNGFAVADVFYRGSSLTSLTASASSHVLEIAVYGEAVEGSFVGSARFVGGGYQVTPDWLHTPHDARVGDQFRVVFVTHHATDARSGDIEEYNELVQFEASGRSKRDETLGPFTDPVIRSVASQFKAVVCTAAVDARTNTGMTDALGVTIRWLDGGWEDRPTLIANSYDQFYGGVWVNSDSGAYVTGNTAYFDPGDDPGDDTSHTIWTGCDAKGAAHPELPMGTNSPMEMVAVGTPNDPEPNNAPLGAVDVSSGYVARPYFFTIAGVTRETLLSLYAISPVFTIVPER
ncbi:choice-of-anchor R domain-containing protein [Candidatus Poriferisodalis sp.]|uniref:choice-of-anchor R domain-containing protein n=1 Tax=Candidatus Poriferisodalis sp. TaxID=3101277 RepID=UPI003AF48EED